MKVLECSQKYTLLFKCSRATNSVVGDEIWQKYKLSQAFKVLVTYKKDEDQLKMKALECSQHFFHFKSMDNFSDVQGQLTP